MTTVDLRDPRDVLVAMFLRVSSFNIGDIIEPLVDGDREVLRVVAIPATETGGRYYVAADDIGEQHEVWRADDPRRPCRDDALAFRQRSLEGVDLGGEA